MRISARATVLSLGIPLFTGIGGCAYYAPPAAPTPHTAMPVSASFAATWDALIDVLSERRIQIRAVDRASGVLVAEPLLIRDGSDSAADCGRGKLLTRTPTPTDAVWNVLVRGDSTTSTVKATVRFSQVDRGSIGTTSAHTEAEVTRNCESLGNWETALEKSVKASAETRSHPTGAN
jgi:hypothetical protein